MELSDKIKNLLKTILYYLIVIVLFFVLNKFAPGDMCNPGLGFLIIMLAPILTICLIIRNFYLLAKGQKQHIYSLILHFILLISVFVIFNIY